MLYQSHLARILPSDCNHSNRSHIFRCPRNKTTRVVKRSNVNTNRANDWPRDQPNALPPSFERKPVPADRISSRQGRIQSSVVELVFVLFSLWPRGLVGVGRVGGIGWGVGGDTSVEMEEAFLCTYGTENQGEEMVGKMSFCSSMSIDCIYIQESSSPNLHERIKSSTFKLLAYTEKWGLNIPPNPPAFVVRPSNAGFFHSAHDLPFLSFQGDTLKFSEPKG